MIPLIVELGVLFSVSVT